MSIFMKQKEKKAFEITFSDRDLDAATISKLLTVQDSIIAVMGTRTFLLISEHDGELLLSLIRDRLDAFALKYKEES